MIYVRPLSSAAPFCPSHPPHFTDPSLRARFTVHPSPSSFDPRPSSPPSRDDDDHRDDDDDEHDDDGV